MKWSSAVAFAAVLCNLVEAAPDGPGWTDWVTNYVTVTTYQKQYETVYVPTTMYVSTTYTVKETYSTTYTVKETYSTTVTVPTTITVPTTVTVPTTIAVPTTVTVPTTVAVPTTVTVTTTVVSVSGQTVVNTVKQTETVNNVQTVQQTQTVNNVQTVQVTSISVATQVVSVSYCPTTSKILTGLVPCPSRITNEQGYTPPTPLPTTYLWGCPPGQLCHPIKVDCNFESNPPAPGYVCPPEQCLPVYPLPPKPNPYKPTSINASCAFITPIDDYFNINPTYFGLNFNIFATFGQATCTTTSAPPTTTMKTTTKYVPMTTPYSSSWAPWTSAAAPPSSSGWGNWQSNGWKSGQPSGAAHVTKKAVLPRQAQVYAGPACYSVCDQAGYYYQSFGSVPALCDPNSAFVLALDAVEACTADPANADANGVTSLVTELDDALNYCAGLNSPIMRKRSPRTEILE